MMGKSLIQELEEMPEGIEKRILLKVFYAPKADLKKLDDECKDFRSQFLKDHNLTELTL